MNIGFLGTGHLATYTVTALRNAGNQSPILLSPRNATVAAELSDAHDCEIAQSNQHLVDSCDIVLLSVRPAHYQSLLADITFKPNQLVISVMAGVSTEDLLKQSNLSHSTLVRSLPIQCSEVGVGPVPVFPANDIAEDFLAQLGSVVVLQSESQFEVAATLSCMHGWVYPWMAAMSTWAEQQGLDQDAATTLTKASVAGALAYSKEKTIGEMQSVVDGLALEGTYTLAGLQELQKTGGIDSWIKAMKIVIEKAQQKN